MPRTCLRCGTIIERLKSSAKFCSGSCRKLYFKRNAGREKYNAWQREYFFKKRRESWHEIECFFCGKSFLPEIRTKTSQIYCSEQCYGRVVRKVSRQNSRAKEFYGRNGILSQFVPLKVEAWRSILVQQGKKCALCDTAENLEMDHVTPLYLGGLHEEKNIRALCHGCNNRLYQESRRTKGVNKSTISYEQ